MAQDGAGRSAYAAAQYGAQVIGMGCCCNAQQASAEQYGGRHFAQTVDASPCCGVRVVDRVDESVCSVHGVGGPQARTANRSGLSIHNALYIEAMTHVTSAYKVP